MPDLNHSNKGKADPSQVAPERERDAPEACPELAEGTAGGTLRLRSGQAAGATLQSRVTFGARNVQEGLPYRWNLSNNRQIDSSDDVLADGPPTILDAAIEPTIRCESRSQGDQQILRAFPLFACFDGIWGIGEYGRTGSADDAAGGSGTGLARVLAGEAAAGSDFGELDHAPHHRVFRFLRCGLLRTLAQFPDCDRTPCAVCRRGAVVLTAPRSRLHDAGDPGVPDGAGLGRLNCGQRVSAFLCRIHADGGGDIHPDGDAAVGASPRAFRRDIPATRRRTGIWPSRWRG